MFPKIGSGTTTCKFSGQCRMQMKSFEKNADITTFRDTILKDLSDDWNLQKKDKAI